jgi:hypothetical protein
MPENVSFFLKQGDKELQNGAPDPEDSMETLF